VTSGPLLQDWGVPADEDIPPSGDGWWHGIPLRPLAGGYSGETYVVGADREPVVVRIYARNPERAAIDASLLHLVRGLVPVPSVLELRHPTRTSPAVLVTELVAGTRLDVLLADPAPAVDLEVLGRSLAEVLTTLAGIPFLDYGMFADASLTLSGDGMPTDLRDWAEDLRGAGRLATWTGSDWQALLDLVDAAQDLLETASASRVERAVLTHSDFNPKNLLVDPATSRVTAVLDWEFAHAGSVYTDIGNFCRFERDPRLLEPLLAGLDRVAPGNVKEHLTLGRANDLWALLELAGRPRPSPVQAIATELLLAQARTNDLEAWPWEAVRVDP
jgi:aminoglycoside phosphotransferase (APT) family kinase protein